MSGLRDNVEKVWANISRAAIKSGRDPEQITLVAVSKTADDNTVREAIELGLNDFGENRSRELWRRAALFPRARWHMIGRLQTNKIRDVIGSACLIHSLDRWRLAEELNRKGLAAGQPIEALLQVDIGREKNKTGVMPGEVKNFLDAVGQLAQIRVMGLMTIAPISGNAESSRPIFRELYRLRAELQRYTWSQVELKYLSMGMSQDYAVAIEEGADIVRVGSAIFG